MKAIVTGASGFVGSHLLSKLLKQGREVSVLIHHNEIPPEIECEVTRGDVTDPSSLRPLFKGADLVFHLAAALGSSRIKEEEFLRVNASGTENVLEAARKAGVRKIVHFSSAGVIGRAEKGEIASENYPPNPRTAYDRSKLEAERTALRFARSGTDIVVIRPGWVYGPGDRRTFKLVRAIHDRRFILITGGDTRQTPIHIEDLVKGILLCAERARKGEIYHLAGSEILSVREIVEVIAASTGVKIPSLSFPLAPARAAAWVMEKAFSVFHEEAPLDRAKLSFFVDPKPLSIEKARRELGFSPEVAFETGINMTVSWYREHAWLGKGQ